MNQNQNIQREFVSFGDEPSTNDGTSSGSILCIGCGGDVSTHPFVQQLKEDIKECHDTIDAVHREYLEDIHDLESTKAELQDKIFDQDEEIKVLEQKLLHQDSEISMIKFDLFKYKNLVNCVSYQLHYRGFPVDSIQPFVQKRLSREVSMDFPNVTVKPRMFQWKEEPQQVTNHNITTSPIRKKRNTGEESTSEALSALRLESENSGQDVTDFGTTGDGDNDNMDLGEGGGDDLGDVEEAAETEVGGGLAGSVKEGEGEGVKEGEEGEKEGGRLDGSVNEGNDGSDAPTPLKTTTAPSKSAKPKNKSKLTDPPRRQSLRLRKNIAKDDAVDDRLHKNIAKDDAVDDDASVEEDNTEPPPEKIGYFQRYDVPSEKQQVLLQELQPATRELANALDEYILSLGEDLVDNDGKNWNEVKLLAQSSSHQYDVCGVATIIHFNILNGRTTGIESLKDYMSNGKHFVRGEGEKSTGTRKRNMKTVVDTLTAVKSLSAATKSDIGLEAIPKGIIVGNLSFRCPVTGSTIEYDRHHCLSGTDNIPSFFDTLDVDTGEIRYLAVKHDAHLQFVDGDSSKKILVTEKRGNAQSWGYEKDERKKNFVFASSSGCMNDATVRMIKRIWVLTGKKYPVFAAYDQNPNGLLSIHKMVNSGIDVIVIMGHPSTTAKYKVTIGRKLKENELTVLRNCIERDEALENGVLNKSYLHTESVNVEQHCSSEHPSLIGMMLNEIDSSFGAAKIQARIRGFITRKRGMRQASDMDAHMDLA